MLFVTAQRDRALRSVEDLAEMGRRKADAMMKRRRALQRSVARMALMGGVGRAKDEDDHDAGAEPAVVTSPSASLACPSAVVLRCHASSLCCAVLSRRRHHWWVSHR